MLNYIKAELYKVTHRKYLPIFLISILACEAAMVGIWMWGSHLNPGFRFDSAISILFPTLMMGLYFVLMVVDMIFSEQYKACTLKNEVSFGISRVRTYLGKLITTAIVGTALCAIMLGFYVGLCAVLLPHSANDGAVMQVLGYNLLMALPLWLGAMCLAHAVFFLVKSTNAASFLFAGFVAMAGVILNLLVLFHLGFVSEISEFLYKFLLTTPFDMMSGGLDWAFLAWAWGIGAGWTIASTAVGITLFRKREIS